MTQRSNQFRTPYWHLEAGGLAGNGRYVRLMSSHHIPVHVGAQTGHVNYGMLRNATLSVSVPSPTVPLSH